MLLSIAMITKNEERAIREVVTDIRKYAPNAEILIVDSSNDKTPQIAEELGVKVIRQFPPQGYGPAMALALRSASGEYVITLDCDNTYPVIMIPQFLKIAHEGNYDLIDGCRLGKKPKAMPLINYFANLGFAILASVLFGKKILDLHSGMRLYKKPMLDQLEFSIRGAALPVELLLKPIKLGYKVKIINIDYIERIGSSTMQPLPSAWWTLKRILMVRFGNNRKLEK